MERKCRNLSALTLKFKVDARKVKEGVGVRGQGHKQKTWGKLAAFEDFPEHAALNDILEDISQKMEEAKIIL